MGAGHKSLLQPTTHHNKATPKARVLGSITPKRAWDTALWLMSGEDGRKKVNKVQCIFYGQSQPLGYWKSWHDVDVLGQGLLIKTQSL